MNKSIEGNTLTVGGYTTNNGIGTHANSKLTYSLNGQYTNFSGSVGRDDEVDYCGCGTQLLQFKIQVDGDWVFDSGYMGIWDGKIPFSINVAGKQYISLYVFDANDEIWGDHADWLDAKLICNGNQARTQNESIITEEPSNFIIYPNPANDKLTVIFSSKKNETVSFKIIDAKGSISNQYSFYAPEGNHTFEMDIRHLAAGNYLLHGNLDNKPNVRRFVVEK